MTASSFSPSRSALPCHLTRSVTSQDQQQRHLSVPLCKAQGKMRGTWLEPECPIGDSIIVWFFFLQHIFNENLLYKSKCQNLCRKQRHKSLKYGFENGELLCPHKLMALDSDCREGLVGQGQPLADFDFDFQLGCQRTGRNAQTWSTDSLKAILCNHYLHSKPFSGGKYTEF